MFKDSIENLKALILFGETKIKMKKTANKYGFENIYLVEDMEEALTISTGISSKGDIVLLSPANASWGMYKSYIERGRHFKELVNEIR